MPATTAGIYLNTGTFGPLPECAIQAAQERLQEEWKRGRIGASAFETMFNTFVAAREGAARLLHAHANEIALTGSTGDGLNIISYVSIGKRETRLLPPITSISACLDR